MLSPLETPVKRRSALWIRFCGDWYAVAPLAILSNDQARLVSTLSEGRGCPT